MFIFINEIPVGDGLVARPLLQSLSAGSDPTVPERSNSEIL